MWLIVSACLAAVLVGLVIVGLAALGVWRSGKRLFRTMEEVADRFGQASDQLSALSDGVTTEPARGLRRTM